MGHGMITEHQRRAILQQMTRLGMDDEEVERLVYLQTGQRSIERLKYTQAGRLVTELAARPTPRQTA